NRNTHATWPVKTLRDAYSEECELTISLPATGLVLILGGNYSAPVGATTVMRMTVEESEGLKVSAAEERRCAAPRAGPCRPRMAVKDLGFDRFDEQNRSPPSTSFLNASNSLLHSSDRRFCRGPLVSFASAG